MASTISSSLEVVLYPTRATRCTGVFSRETMSASFPLPHRPERKTGKFLLPVTWATEEAFTISELPVRAQAEGARAEQG